MSKFVSFRCNAKADKNKTVGGKMESAEKYGSPSRSHPKSRIVDG